MEQQKVKKMRIYSCVRRYDSSGVKMWIVIEDNKKWYRRFDTQQSAVNYFRQLKTKAKMRVQSFKTDKIVKVVYTFFELELRGKVIDFPLFKLKNAEYVLRPKNSNININESLYFDEFAKYDSVIISEFELEYYDVNAIDEILLEAEGVLYKDISEVEYVEKETIKIVKPKTAPKKIPNQVIKKEVPVQPVQIEYININNEHIINNIVNVPVSNEVKEDVVNNNAQIEYIIINNEHIINNIVNAPVSNETQNITQVEYINISNENVANDLVKSEENDQHQIVEETYDTTGTTLIESNMKTSLNIVNSGKVKPIRFNEYTPKRKNIIMTIFACFLGTTFLLALGYTMYYLIKTFVI